LLTDTKNNRVLLLLVVFALVDVMILWEALARYVFSADRVIVRIPMNQAIRRVSWKCCDSFVEITCFLKEPRRERLSPLPKKSETKGDKDLSG
jgi:hypothetical protein